MHKGQAILIKSLKFDVWHKDATKKYIFKTSNKNIFFYSYFFGFFHLDLGSAKNCFYEIKFFSSSIGSIGYKKMRLFYADLKM